MHPLRSEMERRRSAEAPARPKGPQPRRAPAWLYAALLVAMFTVGALAGYKMTHAGHLPRSLDDLTNWVRFGS